jgi:serine protease AprX
MEGKIMSQTKFESIRTQVLAVVVITLCVVYTESIYATPFTPLEWQQTVTSGPQTGQKKLRNSILDIDHNFIDDKLDALPSGTVPARADIVIFLNKCLSFSQIENMFSPFGNIQQKGKFVTFLSIDNVTKADINSIASHPDVAFVEKATPFGPLLNISAPTVKSRVGAISPGANEGLGITGAGVNIAILDSGVDDVIHQAFTGKFVAGYNAVTDTIENPADDAVNGFHGTHVAGIALGQSFIGADPRRISFKGVAPRAGLVDIKVADATTQWACDADAPDGTSWRAHVRALEKAIQQRDAWRIAVINMSFRQCDSFGRSIASNGQDVFSQLVNTAVARGATVVAAAANDSTFGTFSTPAAASLAITVAASAHEDTVERGDDTIANFSNRGPRADDMDGDPLDELKPDVAAPGTNIPNPSMFICVDGIFSARGGTTTGIQRCSGTSMAAPHVAGAAALILEAKPSMNPGSIKELLKQTAETTPDIPGMDSNGTRDSSLDPKYDIGSGSGLVDVFAAVSAVAATDVKFPACIDGESPCLLSLDNTSPPNWLNTTDITLATDPPVAGTANEIRVTVSNAGANDARGVKVNIGVYRFTAGISRFYELGTRVVDVPAGATITVTQAWTPEVGHRCIQATIDFGLDSNFTNNVTQRNIDVKKTASPAVFTFDVENPLTVPVTVQLKPISGNPNWTCSVDQSSFRMDPFTDCPRQVTASLTPVPPGPTVPPILNRKALLGGVSIRGIDQNAGTATCHIFAESKTCDANADGTVNRNDINAIFSNRNLGAQAGDPRDADGDGKITVNDARICTLQCTKPRCAP